MATISTALKMYDGMSPALKSITNAMNIVINSFDAMQDKSANPINTEAIQAARNELASAGRDIQKVEDHIEEARREQEKLNNKVGRGADMFRKIQSAAMAAGGAMALRKSFDLSDTITQNKARLNLMNDGLQTTEQLQHKIFNSAIRSRGLYNDMAESVSKIGILAGKSFDNNDEIIYFVEQMNKQFKIGGAEIQAQQAAMYQLTQAMAAGKLQGDEFKSILENAPLLAQAIEKEFEGVPGTLKDWSSQGMITSDVIKSAMFNAAEETNAAFEKMPWTWAEVWNQAINYVQQAFDPLFESMSDAATWIGENWLELIGVGTMLIPVIGGVVAALSMYNASMGVGWLVTARAVAAKAAHVVASIAETVAIIALTVAQDGLNAAIAMCPIFLLIVAIALVIGLFYGAISAINQLAGTSISATGIIVGSFVWLGSLLRNIIMGLWNIFVSVFNFLYKILASFARFFGNVFRDPLGSIIQMFVDMGNAVMDIIIAIAGAIDKVLGTDMAGSLDAFRDDLMAKAETKFGVELTQIETPGIFDAITPDGRIDMGDAYNQGYTFGENLGNGFNNTGKATSITADTTGGAGGALGDIAQNTGGTAGNTEDMLNTMDKTAEELAYLRDIAEQEAINRFTTAEIKVDMTNHNSINNDMDIDGVVEQLEERIEAAMESAAEGVPA